MMAMQNLIKYSNNYSKIFESLWESFRDEPRAADNAAKIDSESFKFKV